MNRLMNKYKTHKDSIQGAKKAEKYKTWNYNTDTNTNTLEDSQAQYVVMMHPPWTHFAFLAFGSLTSLW